eukprot:TRINITY_DN188_c0_g2_i1.p1 TRINITY_DN188_c0_g2~~TRINITY_DN188_c0_g2_i1.p1  ORF type:complete len:214 (-),score=107.65 TRINITY_DN188_c0_g2_i1:29-598(-)
MSSKICFVTGNQKKLEEVKSIIGSSIPLEAIPIELPELQGEVEEIAKEKCKIAYQKLGRPVITEDTSLCFNSLQGLPGPYIKWFLQKLGHQGLNNLLAAYEDKSAYALCIFAFCDSLESEPLLFIGKTDGRIVPARGPNDFGWDPVFEPQGFNQTFAELDKQVKNTISHRYRALEKLKEFLANNQARWQ